MLAFCVRIFLIRCRASFGLMLHICIVVCTKRGNRELLMNTVKRRILIRETKSACKVTVIPNLSHFMYIVIRGTHRKKMNSVFPVLHAHAFTLPVYLLSWCGVTRFRSFIIINLTYSIHFRSAVHL